MRRQLRAPLAPPAGGEAGRRARDERTARATPGHLRPEGTAGSIVGGRRRHRGPAWPLLYGLALLAGLPIAARAAVAVVGSLSHEYAVQPGGSYEGTIELRNGGSAPEEVKVYQRDLIFYADGRSTYGDPGSLPRSNARWITLSPAQLTVPPGETMRVHYTVRVPDDPSLRGTYWSVLMVEPIAPGSVESAATEPGKLTLTIRQIVRYGVHVIADVAGAKATREVRFSRLELQEKDGRPVLSVDVEDVGERWLIGELSVELYDGQGAYVARYSGGRKRLYPGTSVRYAVDLSGLDRATYQALLVLDSGGDDVFGADVTIVLK